MTSNHTISFIVPVYNVENYLEQCVESILSQSYKNFELILVDDGSTDKSSELCDNLKSKDKRIRVIHKKNGGLSDARNTGLNCAQGEYVIFLDSDDFWLSKDGLQQLIFKLNGTVIYDFICFNCSYYYPSRDKFKKWPSFDGKIVCGVNKEESIVALIRSGVFPMSACLKVIKRDFLLNNNLFFQKGVLAEDILWFIELLEKAQSIAFVNMYIYAYRREVCNSITSVFSEKKYNDLFLVLEKGVERIKTYQWNERTRIALLSFMAYEYCILLAFIYNFSIEARRDREESLYKYDWLLKYDLNPKVKKVALCMRILGRRITLSLLNYYIKRLV